MAKKGIPIVWRLYVRRDPVTGQEKIFARRKHTHASSERLLAFRKCVRESMSNFTAPAGVSARERAKAVREALAAAAKRCSEEVKRMYA